MRFGFPLKNAEQHEIDKPTGERLPNGDVQNMGDHKRQSVEQRVNDVQHRSDKQEGKFNWLCNASQK